MKFPILLQESMGIKLSFISYMHLTSFLYLLGLFNLSTVSLQQSWYLRIVIFIVQCWHYDHSFLLIWHITFYESGPHTFNITLYDKRLEVFSSSSSLGDQEGMASPREQRIRSQFTGVAYLLGFPWPPVIYNMLMTFTLLIMAQQPNLTPHGAQ